MAQGQFTKREARNVREALQEILDALPKSKQLEFLGHFNDLFLFLDAAEKAAPDESAA
jgi:hypothetical protein